MLEVLYDTASNEVRGWCADPNQFGNFKLLPNYAIAILPISPPDYDSLTFYVDLANQTISGTPTPPNPDELRVVEILSNSPPVIPMTEVRELLEIFAKRLGF